jgi:hypothetical protein
MRDEALCANDQRKKREQIRNPFQTAAVVQGFAAGCLRGRLWWRRKQ